MGMVTVVNSKGGVGKTTVALGLASAAQAAGVRTLVVDLDPQGSATWALRPELDPSAPDLTSILAGGDPGSLADAVHPSAWGDDVDVVPADAALQELEARLTGEDRFDRLRTAAVGIEGDYELVIVDAAPAMGTITANSLGAADLGLVVAEPAALALRGVELVDAAVARVSGATGRPALPLKVVVNRVPPRGSEASRQLDALAGLAGRRVWEPHLPRRVVLAEALADGTPIHWWGTRADEVTGVLDQLLARVRRSLARR